MSSVALPKLLAKELLDLVASHFNLKEKEYFGIAFTDETFYIESISYLKDNATIELFFLNAKSCIYKELIEVDSEVVFELAAYILQEAKGDFSSNEVVRNELKKLPALPTPALKEHPSLAYCEDRVIEHYKKLNGQTRGQAIVNYMSIVESLPTYGVHYYAVKDKQGIPWWLGLSYKGIFQYDYHDKVKPRKIFQWRQLENLYFREKKFSVEVHDPRRASVTRRTFGHSGIAVHTWYACPALIKSIWAMAISQHQFYLDRKQSKVKTRQNNSKYVLTFARLKEFVMNSCLSGFGLTLLFNLSNFGHTSSSSWLSVPARSTASSFVAFTQHFGYCLVKQSKIHAARSLSEIAIDLTETGTLKTSKLANMGSKGKIISGSSGSLLSSGSQESDSSQSAKKDMLAALKSRQEALEETLRQRLEELKKLCLREAELTGKLPREYPLDPGEEPPIVRRRIGTAFKLDEQKILPKGEEAELERLEREFAIQSQITEAARRLASDPNVSKKLKKQRKTSNHKRFPSTGSCAEAGGSSSLQNSPIRSLPHWNSQSSMPSTPDLRVRSPHYVHSTRSVDISPTRLHSLAQHFRHRSSSLESQGKLLGSENETGSPDFYTPRTRSSNGSDPMDDCSSCTSHSSSEHYYPAQMNPNYSTLAEDSPSKARERQRQRHKSAGNLVSSNSGSMPNLAARNGTGHHRVYLHSQSQPSSQYRIKEYPLYIEGSSTPVVVRSLENDQEGHYSVKAQFKTSNSYTAGGMFKENWHGDEVDSVRLTPSRSQIIRTPSLGREGHEKGSGRTAVSDELRLWYQRSTASHKEHSRLSHTSSTSSDSSSQYSTSSQSTFVAHSRVTRMPQMCKATSVCNLEVGSDHEREINSEYYYADIAVSLQNFSKVSTSVFSSGTELSGLSQELTLTTYNDSCFLDSPLYPELADVQWYGQEKAKPGTLV
ncbi:UNVERIFIED_CONTAM: hypothetical protein H355_012004 [Colinus virginianus]|nr:hypothetical protein H355_012004 [Colinus virginianus]